MAFFDFYICVHYKKAIDVCVYCMSNRAAEVPSNGGMTQIHLAEACDCSSDFWIPQTLRYGAICAVPIHVERRSLSSTHFKSGQWDKPAAET